MRSWRRGSISTNSDEIENQLSTSKSDAFNTSIATGSHDLSREQILHSLFGSVGELANGKLFLCLLN